MLLWLLTFAAPWSIALPVAEPLSSVAACSGTADFTTSGRGEARLRFVGVQLVFPEVKSRDPGSWRLRTGDARPQVEVSGDPPQRLGGSCSAEQQVDRRQRDHQHQQGQRDAHPQEVLAFVAAGAGDHHQGWVAGAEREGVGTSYRRNEGESRVRARRFRQSRPSTVSAANPLLTSPAAQGEEPSPGVALCSLPCKVGEGWGGVALPLGSTPPQSTPKSPPCVPASAPHPHAIPR